MTNLLHKPIEDITVDDLDALIDEQVRENEQLEFMRTLSSKKGDDRWLVDQKDVGNHAKTCIVEEVVAFANAYGGVLLVGIDESNDGLDAATAIYKLPKCEKLANRFKLIFRDCVEPELPNLEIRGINTEREAGVLIIRVGRSRLAPHRVTINKKCTVRRQDRCQELSMMEIQDLVLNTTRGLDRVKHKLECRKDSFEEEFCSLTNPQESFGIRITGVPIDEQRYVDTLFDDKKLDSKYTLPPSPFEKGDPRNYLLNDLLGSYRPILHGAREDTINSNRPTHYFTYGEVHCDGLIELGFLSINEQFTTVSANMQPNWIVGVFVHLLTWVVKFRKHTFTVGSEYAIEAEIHTRSTLIRLGSNKLIQEQREQDHARQFSLDTKLQNIVFPTYSFGENVNTEDLTKLFERDLLNWRGLHQP